MKRFLSTSVAIILFVGITIIAFPLNFVYSENEQVTTQNKQYVFDYGVDNELNFTYDIIDGKIYITDFDIKGKTTELIIPSQIEGHPVVSVKHNGEIYNKNALQSVIFEDGIETIDEVYLSQCPNLKEIHLPNTLKNGDFTFWDCPSLTSTVIPGSLEQIPDNLFYKCVNLKNVKIENGVKIIGKSSFHGCDSLKSIIIPDSVELLDDFAFDSCDSLKDVTLSQKVMYINQYAFEDTAVEKIKLPNSLKEIGYRAFARAPLKEIIIPFSVEKIGEYAFSGCTQLTTLTMSANTYTAKNVFWSSSNLENVTINGYMTKNLFNALINNTKYGEKIFNDYNEDFIIFDGNYLAKYKGQDKNPVIPNNVTELGELAFQYSEIDSVTFPKAKIAEIPSYCFKGSKVKEIIIPANVGKIKEYAFYGCGNLEKLTIENGVQSVASNAFINCSSLTEEKVNIGKGVRVAVDAFRQTPLDKNWIEGQEINDNLQETPVMKTLTVGSDMTMRVNNNAITFTDAKPFIDGNNRTQIPVRAVADVLDSIVDWDENSKTVTIRTQNGDIVTLVIGSDIMTVNGKAEQMDTVAIIKDDRTYIPARFVAEAMGLTVEWIN